MADDQKVESSDIEVEAAVASVNDELETIKADHEAAVDGLTSTIAERDAKITELEESAAALTSELEETKAKLDETSTQLGEAEATIRTMVRTAQAKDAGIADDKVEDTLAKFDAVDDEAFAAMLDLVKTQAHVSLESVNDNPAPAPAPEPVVEEVEAEVKQRIQKLAPGGGYILASANSITEFCKPENVFAMAEAKNKYGWYPIGLD